jgi:hypothetical protein
MNNIFHDAPESKPQWIAELDTAVDSVLSTVVMMSAGLASAFLLCQLCHRAGTLSSMVATRHGGYRAGTLSSMVATRHGGYRAGTLSIMVATERWPL